jgi:hypothetical protein
MTSLKCGPAALRMAATAAAGLLAVATAAGAQTAQSGTQEPASRPITLGSLQLFPSISLRDVGLDSNIYNSSFLAREDFTYTVAPRLRGELPLGDTRLVGTGALGFVYFQKSKDQESVNAAASGLFEVREGRIRPSVQGGFSRSRERRGDVDVRALSLTTSGRAGVEVGVSGVTSLTTWVTHDDTAFASGEQFHGQDLSEQLDRATTTYAAGARFDLTPLTSVVAAAAFEQIRFKVERIRDADSWKFVPTVSFAEGAILNGQVSAGLRDFRPLSRAMQPFRGLVAEGGVRFSVAGVSRFELRGNRDLVYSYEELQPYYLESGGHITLYQRVVGPVDLIALAGRRVFRYENLTGVTLPERVETMTNWGGGVGVRIDDNMRLSFTLDRERRISPASALREFERIRAFSALDYVP